MRILCLVILSIVALQLSAQSANPFSKLKYDRVVMYDFKPNGDKGTEIVDGDGNPLQKVLKQVILDSVTVRQFSRNLNEKQSYGAGTASCFDPHTGLVYFLENKPVAQVSICLGCNRLYSTLDLPAQRQGKQGSGDDVYYIANGLSKSFRAYLNGLLVKHGFSHQIKDGASAFDK